MTELAAVGPEFIFLSYKLDTWCHTAANFCLWRQLAL